MEIKFLLEDSGEWRVESGEWRVESGQWTEDRGQRTVESGQWNTGNGKQKTENRKQKWINKGEVSLHDECSLIDEAGKDFPASGSFSNSYGCLEFQEFL